MTIDNRTTNLDLPLPNGDNDFEADVQRLRDALTALDAAVFGRAVIADITAAIAALVGGAPANLNTLGELAASIGNDANFASTVSSALGAITTALGGKAPTTHSHAIGDITGLVAALAAKLESIPVASASVVGGVKVGTGLTIDGGGVLSLAGGGSTQTFDEVFFTPTAGQTVFTVTGGYVPGRCELFLNGTRLKPGDDYTATNGTSFTLAVGASTVDDLCLVRWATFDVANAVSKAGDTMTGHLNVPSGAAGTQVPQAQEVLLKTGGTMTGAINEAHGADIASAATLNLGAATGNVVDVTGTTAVTAITLADGAQRMVRFIGALTLTNGPSLILLGGANIVTAAGDVALFRGYAAGVVRMVGFARAASLAATLAGTETLTNKSLTNPVVTDVTEPPFAPAGGTAFTVNLANGNFQRFTTTGNCTITLPAAVAGKTYTVVVAFGGAHTVTFNGGTLIKWAGGTAPTPTSVNGKEDWYVFSCLDTVSTRGADSGRNF